MYGKFLDRLLNLNAKDQSLVSGTTYGGKDRNCALGKAVKAPYSISEGLIGKCLGLTSDEHTEVMNTNDRFKGSNEDRYKHVLDEISKIHEEQKKNKKH